MGEQRPTCIAVLAVVAAAVMLVLSTFGVDSPTVEAAKKKQKVTDGNSLFPLKLCLIFVS